MSKNEQVVDPKPKNELVFDQKPKLSSLSTEINQLYNQILTAGIYMGIPPFTYPSAGTVSSPFSP